MTLEQAKEGLRIERFNMREACNSLAAARIKQRMAEKERDQWRACATALASSLTNYEVQPGQTHVQALAAFEKLNQSP